MPSPYSPRLTFISPGPRGDARSLAACHLYKCGPLTNTDYHQVAGKRRRPAAPGAADHRQRRADRGALHAGASRRLRSGNRPRLSRPVSVHARRPCVDVSQPALDHAAVRRLRHGPPDQRTLQVPARQRADRPQHRVRSADAHGPRLRRSALARRSRPARRRRRYARRHGGAVRRHRPGGGLRVDDDQRPGHHRHGVLPGQRPTTAASIGSSCAAPSRTTSSRSSTPRTRSSFRRSRRCGSCAT